MTILSKEVTGLTARCRDYAQEMWKFVSKKWSHIFPSANAYFVAKAFCNNAKRLGGKEFLAQMSDSVDYLRKDVPDTIILVMDLHEIIQVVLPLIEKPHKKELVRTFIIQLSKFCLPGPLKDQLWFFGNPANKGVLAGHTPKGWISCKDRYEVLKADMSSSRCYLDSDGKLPLEVGTTPKARPTLFADDVFFLFDEIVTSSGRKMNAKEEAEIFAGVKNFLLTICVCTIVNLIVCE